MNDSEHHEPLQIVGVPQEDRFEIKHSLSGIIACVMAGVAMVCWLLGVLADMQGSGLWLVLLIVAWSAMVSFCLIGLGLAIHGLIPRRRRKIFPILGLVLNPLVMLLCLFYFLWPTPDYLVAAAARGDRSAIDHALWLGVEMHDVSTLENDNVPAGATALTAAVQAGQFDTVAYLLSLEADVNLPDAHQGTPLYYAVIDSHTDITQLLLEHGADVHLAGPEGDPLQVAARQGHQAILELLLDHGAKVRTRDNHSPLHAAAGLGHNGIVRRLIEAGAKVNLRTADGRTPAHAAASHGHIHVLKLLIEHKADINLVDNQGISPLDLALEAGHEAVARLLLESGGQVGIFTAIAMKDTDRLAQIITSQPESLKLHRKGLTPLHEAIRLGDAMMVKTLLEHDADPHAPTADGRSLTPLQMAVLHDQTPIALLLMPSKPDVNRVVRQGEVIAPLLFFAVDKSNVAMTTLLLEHGADVNALCETPHAIARPLFFAVQRNAPEVAKALIAHHAQVDGRKNNMSPTPLYEAVRLGHLEMVVLLLQHKANPQAVVGDASPLSLAQDRRTRDPLVYDRILNLLTGDTPLPTTLPSTTQ